MAVTDKQVETKRERVDKLAEEARELRHQLRTKAAGATNEVVAAKLDVEEERLKAEVAALKSSVKAKVDADDLVAPSTEPTPPADKGGKTGGNK
jgi:hypothetical protein